MICLNMIVRNEADRILRALESAKPYISTFAIFDTGSTDGTDEMIVNWGRENGINGIIAHGSFVNFSQARNQALDLARTWRDNPTADVPSFTHILLMDADMELVVEDPASLRDLRGEMYEMIQKAGMVSYHNPRLLAAWSKANYIGVTHEYLNVAPYGTITGAHFKDNADGSNRVNKFERDIELLRKDLETDGFNARSWFYLGNSYRDSNQYELAIDAYLMRLSIGGWDEEDFITRCNIASCYKDLNNQAEFIHWALLAYQHRPSRAESLYDLAHYFREKGHNQLAMLFAEMGVNIERPDDKLFVNDYVYSHGFLEEISIAGWYTDRRDRAFHVNNRLALDPKAPEHTRRQARTNMVHYLRPLKELAPSVIQKQIDLKPDDGFIAMNPSITAAPSGALECVVRTVNYKIDDQGRYMIGEKGCGDAPIVTANWYVTLDEDLKTTASQPIVWLRPQPKFDLVMGLEDMRLFWYGDRRMFNACVREQSERGECEQWQGELHPFDEIAKVHDCERISDGEKTEKNWAVVTAYPLLQYMYRLDRLRAADGSMIHLKTTQAVDNISGSSQWIKFAYGHLAIVHEAVYHPAHGKRVYQHRFAFRAHTGPLRLSLPFVFQDVQIEFCAGLARHPNSSDLVMSFGIRDCEAWLATVSEADVSDMMGL